MIDISTLTLGEVAKIEDLSGMPISAIADDDRPKGLALAALAFIVKRRQGDPAFTFNKAQELTFAEVNDLLGMDEPEDEEDDPKAADAS